MRTNYWQTLEPGVIYHIYNRAIGHGNLFNNADNYLFFLEKWRLYLPYLDVFAYCLLPNHFHFLARVKPIDNTLLEHIAKQKTVQSEQFLQSEISYNTYLEGQFKRLFSSYALAFNKQQNRRGSLFQKRFKRISVDNEFRQVYLLAYIHYNPVRHRIWKTAEGWRYSSWNAYLNMSKSSFINRKEVLDWFHEDEPIALKMLLEYHEDFRFDTRSKYLLE